MPLGDDVLFTFLFSDDQALISGDNDVSSYMLRHLQQENMRTGDTINGEKTELMAVEDETAEDLDLGHCRVRIYPPFRYFGVSSSSNGKFSMNTSDKVAQ